MNQNCLRACSHIGYCKLNAEQTKSCKVTNNPLEKPLIVGKTWEQIQMMQSRKEP